MTVPSRLSQMGTVRPAIVASYPKTSRSRCRSATNAKTTTAMYVNGFFIPPSYPLPPDLSNES